MSGFDFDPDESFELALHRAAEAQNEAGHHFLAVVTAQAAVEAVAQPFSRRCSESTSHGRCRP